MHSPIYAKPLEHLVSRRRESNPRHELGRLGYIPANTTSAMLGENADGKLVTATIVHHLLDLAPINVLTRVILCVHERVSLLDREAKFVVPLQ
jgi:hypothetical protein